MQVTGLRARFFLTILTVLFGVAGVSIVLHSLFLKDERLELIDQQVRETASVLVDSEIGTLKQLDFEKADDIISEELGESRIGKFFIIRNQQDDVIFESSSAKLLPISEVPRSPQWVKIITKGKFIRILNLQLPSVPDRTLQVGIVLDESLVVPQYISKTTGIFITAILLFGLAVSWFSTSFLLNPIKQLEGFLSSIHEKSKHQSILPSVPENLRPRNGVAPQDEFDKMVTVLNSLIDRVNKNYQLSRLWAYQMAHELKTPLFILRLQFENLEQKYSISSEDSRNISTEEKKIAETINSFLAWAELENSSKQQHLFVNKIGDILEDVKNRLVRSSERNVKTEIIDNFNVVSNPQHLEQLITNILSNALHYSEKSSEVTVKSELKSLIIKDHGKGIPEEVLARIGEPFNKGHSNETDFTGSGLGLAWVNSICRMYDWKFEIQSDTNGTEIKISFDE